MSHLNASVTFTALSVLSSGLGYLMRDVISAFETSICESFITVYDDEITFLLMLLVVCLQGTK